MIFDLPWWVWFYILLIASVGLGGVRDDLREGRSLINATVSFLPTVLLLSFVLTYWNPQVSERLGRAVWLLFSVATVWEASAAIRDLRNIRTDDAFSSRGNLLFKLVGLVLYVAVVTPAFAWGAISCARVW